MEAFIFYQIKSACCLGLFSLVYLLLIRNLTFYRLNRFYLLSAMILSFVIPAVTIRMPAADRAGVLNIVLDTITINASADGMDPTLVRPWTVWIKYVYPAVSLVFAGFFIQQLMGLWAIIRRHGIQRKDRMLWVTIPDNLPAFSFFNILFISFSASGDLKGNPVIRHEMAHARQFHSVDILLAELMKIVQWFNPFIYIIRRLLKETHEYLADETVLEQNSDPAGYRLLLLSQVFGIQPGISNSFNYSLIKKRFTMMSKEKSPLIRQVRYLLALPLALLLIFIFGCREAASSLGNESAGKQGTAAVNNLKAGNESGIADDSIYIKVDEMPRFQGGEIENVLFYVQQHVIYPEAAKKSHIQGKVYVQFIVNELGNVVEAKVVKGINVEKDENAVVVAGYKDKDMQGIKDAAKELDEEAVRVISSMPAWEPGKKDGKPVKVSFTIPIKFVLQ